MAVNTPYKDTTATTTNHTANYDLPLWTGEDTTSWLTQMNDAMNKIDDGMVDAKSKALEVVGIAADAKKLADETKAESDESAKIVADYNDRLTTVEEKVKEHTEDITNLNTRGDQFDVELHSVQEVQKKTTADLATLAEKVESNKTEVDGKIENISTTIVNNKADADSKIATTNETVAQISAKEQALEETVTSNTGAIVEINKNVEDLDGRMDSIENAQSSQGNAITSMTKDIDSMKIRLDGDDNAIAGLTTRMAAVEKTAQTTETNLTTLSENTQNSFTELDTRLSGDEEQITAIDGRVTALEEGGGSAKTLPKMIRSGLVLSTLTPGYKIISSAVVIEDDCIFINCTFSLVSSITIGVNYIYFDENSPAITAIKEKFGDNISLIGASSPVMMDDKSLVGDARFNRYTVGGTTTTCITLFTTSTLSSTTTNFKTNMIALPYKE